MTRSVIAAGVILTFGMTAAMAQSSSPVAVHAGIGGLVSIQPPGYDGRGTPYLDNSLAGTVPGFNVTTSIWFGERSLIAVEVGSTSSLEVVQSGRFVVGLGPVRARHRDTLLSVLPGVRFGDGRTVIEVKAGVSLLCGTPRREAFEYDDPGGVVAFTAGLDIVAPLGDRVALGPHFRYSYANRAEDALYFGLGRHIVRVGAVLRFRLTE